jgi:hypothetical protein
MPKTPPFIVNMKSHSRSMKNHGKHRRTSPPVHGSPADGAGAGQPVRTSLPQAFWRTIYKPIDFALAPGTVTYIDPRVVADHLKYMQQKVQDVMALMTQIDLEIKPPPSPSIPHTGIIAGEIIGRRLWHILSDGSLCSLAHLHIWEPGVTQTGNLDELVEGTFQPIYGGVYAFKQDSHHPIYAEVESLRSRLGWDRPYPSGDGRSLIGCALGTVKLWGDVVEHEVGYRASFAKIEKIERAWFKPDLAILPRKLADYGIIP